MIEGLKIEASALIQKGYCLAVDAHSKPVWTGELKDLPTNGVYHKLFVSYQDYGRWKEGLNA